MTPAQKAGIVKGKRYRVIDEGGERAFKVGSVVEMYQDDGSIEPLFVLVSGSCRYENADGFKGAYLHVRCVKAEEDEK